MLTPEIDDTLENITQAAAPSYGYRLDTEPATPVAEKRNDKRGGNRVRGTIDDLAAVRQAVLMMLATEQGEHPIYAANYGLRTIDLIGKPHSYAANELRRRITETLLTDDRITAVHSFASQTSGDVLTMTFTVDTIFGTFQAGKEVTP